MAMGVHEVLARRAPASLLVLNYHRIWRSRGFNQSSYDDGVFDTDVETFRTQMQWLKDSTTILDEEELLKLNDRVSFRRGETYSAVTFDDGYLECYELIKPILDKLGIRGIFFVPFDMLESRRLGWWDIAAYLLKKTVRTSIRLRDDVYPLGPNLTPSLKRILTVFKTEPFSRTEGFLAQLSEACDVSFPTKDEQSSQLMDWSQVRALRAAGHAIGSHSLSHRVLATLDVSTQASEIIDSRRQLQAILGEGIVSFAYPVGGPQHINDHSVRLAREAGYSQAFTFNTGVSRAPIENMFTIPRESAKSMDLLKAKVMLPGLMGLERHQAA